MGTRVIDRDELRYIVADAAYDAHYSGDDLAALLRVVNEAERVAVGGHVVCGVGCPLTQAGLPLRGMAREFFAGFDYAMNRLFCSGGRYVVQVVDTDERP